MDSVEACANSAQNTMDSFEVNMKQIEQTNALLNNIESKLTDFFGKGSSTKTQENIQKEIIVNPSIDKNHDLPKSVPGNMSTSQSHNSMLGLQPKNSESEPFFENYLTAIDNAQHKDLTKPICLPQSFNMVRSANYGVEDLRDAKIISSESIQPRVSISSTGSSNILDRMSQLEDSYQSRIRILEEKLNYSDKQIQQNSAINEKLNLELTSLRKNLVNKKDEYVLDLQKSLKEQKECLLNEFKNTIQAKDDALVRSKHQVELYRQKYENLNYEYNILLEKKEDLETKSRLDDKNKERLSEKHQNLMNVHNEMIQLDIQKNIRISSTHNNNFFNGAIVNQRESSRVRKNDDKEASDLKILNEALEIYQKELSNLKENNHSIRRQFESELEHLNGDMRAQREENSILRKKISQQKLINSKLVRKLENIKTNQDSVNSNLNYQVCIEQGREEQGSVKQEDSQFQEHYKENINELNLVYKNTPNQVVNYKGIDVEDTIITEDFPFTNPQIKSEWRNSCSSIPRVVLKDIVSQTEYQKKANQNKFSEKPPCYVDNNTLQKFTTHKAKKIVQTERLMSLNEFEEKVTKLKCLVSSKFSICEGRDLEKLSTNTSSKPIRSTHPKQETSRERVRSGSQPRKRLH